MHQNWIYGHQVEKEASYEGFIHWYFLLGEANNGIIRTFWELFIEIIPKISKENIFLCAGSGFSSVVVKILLRI